MGEAVAFYLLLQYFDFVNLVGIRVYYVNAAGNAGIEGMDRSQNFQGLLGIGHRCADQGLFHRPQLAGSIPRAQVPGGRHHVLVVLDLLIFDLDPVAERTSGDIVQPDAHGAVRHIIRLIRFGIAVFDICDQLPNPYLHLFTDRHRFNTSGSRSAQG